MAKLDWSTVRKISESVSKVLDWLDIPGTDLDNWAHRAIDIVISLIPVKSMGGGEKHDEAVGQLADAGLDPTDAQVVVKAAYKMLKKERPELFPGAMPDGPEPH